MDDSSGQRMLDDDMTPGWHLITLFVADRGEPGACGPEVPRWLRSRLFFVSRDEDGVAQGVLQVVLGEDASPVELIITVRPDRRRKGIATSLYRAAQDFGINVEALSGNCGLTREGAAFQSGRRAKTATQDRLP